MIPITVSIATLNFSLRKKTKLPPVTGALPAHDSLQLDCEMTADSLKSRLAVRFFFLVTLLFIIIYYLFIIYVFATGYSIGARSKRVGFMGAAGQQILWMPGPSQRCSH